MARGSSHQRIYLFSGCAVGPELSIAHRRRSDGVQNSIIDARHRERARPPESSFDGGKSYTTRS